MSIYFQYPAIDDYPSFSYTTVIKEPAPDTAEDEDKIKREDIIELRDFLTLKPV